MPPSGPRSLCQRGKRQGSARAPEFTFLVSLPAKLLRSVPPVRRYPTFRDVTIAREAQNRGERLMKWTPGGESQDIEDRRDESGGDGGGGFQFGGMHIGIGGAIVLLILSFVFRTNFF